MNTRQFISYIGWAAFFVYATLTQGCAVSQSAAEAESALEAPNPMTFRVVGFTAEERAIIETAAAAWCDATGECVEFTEDGDSEFAVVDHTCTGGNFATTCKYDNGVLSVQIIPRRDSPEWAHTLYYGALHEIGHVLGCWKHLPGRNQMSSDWLELPGYLSDADIQCALRDGA